MPRAHPCSSPGKPRYDTPKSYCPIALLNTTAKLLSVIVAEQLTFIGEKYEGVLPPTHFGGHPGRTTTDSMHLLVQKVKHAWQQKQVASVLFLDIEGAFPNAVTERLLHNMWKRGVPVKYIAFVKNLLRDRRTILHFDDYVSSAIQITNGIGQGDPLSMILYIFYNSDILSIPKITQKMNEYVLSFVDDTTLLAMGSSFKVTHQILADMMTRDGGAIQWSKDHNSRFEPSKFALLDFTQAKEADPTHPKQTRLLSHPSLIIPGLATIQPSSSARYLGVIFDQELRWNVQVQYAAGKGAAWTNQLRRLAKPSFGLKPSQLRQMYIGVAIPKMLYAVDVWCIPIHGGTSGSRRLGSVGVIKALVREQFWEGFPPSGKPPPCIKL